MNGVGISVASAFVLIAVAPRPGLWRSAIENGSEITLQWEQVLGGRRGKLLDFTRVPTNFRESTTVSSSLPPAYLQPTSWRTVDAVDHRRRRRVRSRSDVNLSSHLTHNTSWVSRSTFLAAARARAAALLAAMRAFCSSVRLGPAGGGGCTAWPSASSSRR